MTCLKACSFISIILIGGCDLKNFIRMFARALSRRRGRYSTIGTFCNEWSPDFTESWSRSVHRPKNLTSRTRLRTASTRRRTRPIIASLTDYSAPNVLIIYFHIVTDVLLFCSRVSTYYDKKYRQNHAEGLIIIDIHIYVYRRRDAKVLRIK